MTSNTGIINMTFDQLLDSRIEVKLDERVSVAPAEPPELIKLEEAKEICRCSIEVIQSLFDDRENNQFPGVKLAPRTFRVDKERLIHWLRNGGLNGINQENGSK